MMYNLDEICLIPSMISEIESRSECSTRYQKDSKLPLFVSPMSTLIDVKNIDEFNEHGFNTILPRTVPFEVRLDFLTKGYWVAVGLKEAEVLYRMFSTSVIQDGELQYTPHICIDQANGHMKKLLEICKSLKDLLKNNIQIMTGNIANENVYKHYAEAGIDYIRIGIGSGNVCSTTLLTGIFYPMASLIQNCNNMKQYISYEYHKERQMLEVEDTPYIKDPIKDKQLKYRSIPKIVADGGFENISQIIKALALGADYCMLGRIVAGFKEACGNYYEDEFGVMYRTYYGMSTHIAQELIHDASSSDDELQIKQSEGVIKPVKIDSDINDWVWSFENSLKSTMSYTNKLHLEDFINDVISYEIMNPTNIQNKRLDAHVK